MNLRRRGLPDDGEAIIAREVRLWPVFDAAEQADLLDLADWLLRRKHWEAAAGFELDDTIRSVVAVLAAVPVLGLGTDGYREVSAIVVHPSSTVTTGERAGPIAGTRSRTPLSVHGLAADRYGPVLIAWDEARRSARHPGRGRNVVFHEMAHKLDMADGLVDGTPQMERPAMARWVEVCTGVFEDLQRGVPRPPLRPYGATNPAEFFAVATEAFFDAPAPLAAAEPELYGVLRDHYRQDPARWSARGATPSPAGDGG